MVAACTGVLLVGLLWMVSSSKHHTPRIVPTPPSAPAVTPGKPSGTLGAKNGVIIFPDHGPRIWVARAKTIVGRADTGTVEMTGVSCSLYHNGQETLRVLAARGVAHAQGSTVVVSLLGGIHAQDLQRDLSCTADAFDWSAANDCVSATNVAWRGAGFTHRADHAELSTDLTRAVFTGKVRTRTLK